jgi:hypothetical protein
MFLIIWRGYGLLAFGAIVFTLSCCVGGLEYGRAGFLVAGVVGVACGLPCYVYGRRWNRGTGKHTLYGVPMEIWGAILMALGGFVAVMMLIAGLRLGWRP